MKSPTTYSIRQVSKLSGLPASTLRYYESIGLVQPINRDVSSKQRVYTEQDVNRIDALSCLSATGMSLRDMRSYMDHMSHGKASAKLEIELLRAQAARIETERQYLEVRERYVALKIAYWHAVEEDNTEAIAAIRTEARILAQELKHPKES